MFQIVCCIQKKKKITVGLTGFYGVLVTTVTDGVMCTFIDKSKDFFFTKTLFFLILRKSVVPGAELNLRPHWHYYSGKEVPEPYQLKKKKLSAMDCFCLI